MEDEQEDVKRMTDFINQHKSNYENNFQLEFQDFVNFKQDYSDQEYEDGLESNHEDDIENYYTGSTQSTVLTEEEEHVVESCSDPELKKLLILNRTKNMQLLKLHKKMQDVLLECEKEIEEKHLILMNSEPKQVTQQQTFIWKLAAPYFKDKKFFPCPLNEDAARKRSKNELSFYDLVPSPKWTPIEFDRLTNAIKCNYNINRQNNVMSQINALKARMHHEECEDKSKVEELLNLKEQLEDLKSDDKTPPLNSNELIDWYKVAETFLKDKHTAVECQSVWHMLVHPLINKSEWSDEENKKLETIAKQKNYQNWDDIACELNTDRTGFTTCLHYFSKLCDKFKRNKFTSEEDTFLLEIVDLYKIGNFIPWNKVVCHFTNRSRHQLYHRYTYFLSQNHVKRGKFSEAEDILLIILVNKFGKNFKKCSEYMPNRSQVQIKSRYNSNLQRHIKKGTFTSQDDQIIYDFAQKTGEKNWSALTEKLNRCNAQIRQRYRLIKTFLKGNPNAKVSDIPKRRHRFDEVNEGQHNFLNYMAEQYKDVEYIPTLSMIEQSLQVELGTSTLEKPLPSKSAKTCDEVKPKNIDSMLTEFFSSSMKMKQCSVISETSLNEAAVNVEEMLKLLAVHLAVPKDVECNVHLDNIDLEILERISNKQFDSTQLDINKLVSPNISSLVGLRSLIIKHKVYKTNQKNKTAEKKSRKQDPETLLHRELFSKRFEALFEWSALLSMEKPNQLDCPGEASSANKRPVSPDNITIKKRKIDVSTLTRLSYNAKNAQLKLVDKSVVENLMKNKNNVNIIRIETITGSDGAVQPVLNLNHCVDDQIYASPNSSSISNVIEDIIDEEDIQDVEKLNVILKSMKAEANSDSNHSSEEYQAIKGDVQLLKEILKYEQVKVKPDPDC